HYFGDGFGDGGAGGEAFGETGGAGVGAGLASSNSTSKINVELGAISGPTVRSPYARFGGTKNLYFDPTFISCSPSVQPLITPLRGKLAGSPRLYELSNSVPLIS